MQATSYDVVLYPNKPVYAAHPDRLAVLGTLYGLRPAPIEKCRVLEIGCGDGGHLFGLAFNYPESEFLGVDLAATPIRIGQDVAAQLRLDNLQLRVADILKLGPELGQFDYIVAHGIYSWIPAEIREHLLSAFASLLSAHGLGYVSYNTRPGFHLRRVVRELLRLHGGPSQDDPTLRIARARELITTVLELDTGGRGLDRMKREFELLSAAPDSRLFHDDMADENHAPYFHEFVVAAEQHGLRYVSEVPYASIHWQRLPGAAGAFLRRLGEDRVRREQYLDFFVARRFRQTVLCKSDVAVLDEPSPAALRELSVSVPSTLIESLEKRLAAQAPRADGAPDVAELCLRYLARHSPRAVGFDELCRVLNAAPPAGVSATESARLAAALWELYCGGAVELHTRPPACVSAPGTHPRVSRLARVELELERVLTSQEHRPIQLNHAFARQLVPLLDGSRDRAVLATELLSRARAVKRPDNQPIEDHAEALAFVSERLDAELTHLARVGLLVQ